MARRTTSIKIEGELWKAFKIDCLKKDVELSEKLERLIKKEIGKK